MSNRVEGKVWLYELIESPMSSVGVSCLECHWNEACGAYAGKDWNKERVGLGKGKEWLATLSSLLASCMNTSTITLGRLDSAFLLVPKVSMYGSSVIWYNSYLYLWHSTSIYWTYHVLSKNKTKTIRAILKYNNKNNSNNNSNKLGLCTCTMGGKASRSAGSCFKPSRAAWKREQGGLVSCDSGLKSPAQELGYFFPGQRGAIRSFVMRKWQDPTAFKGSTEGEREDEGTKIGEKGSDGRAGSEAEQRCVIGCGAQACSMAKTTLRFWVCVIRQTALSSCPNSVLGVPYLFKRYVKCRGLELVGTYVFNHNSLSTWSLYEVKTLAA